MMTRKRKREKLIFMKVWSHETRYNIFGEQLPENFKIAINQDINKVDLVLVIGTSLKVAPLLI